MAKAQKISDDEISASLEKMKISLQNKEKAAQNKIEQAKNDAINQVKKWQQRLLLKLSKKF